MYATVKYGSYLVQTRAARNNPYEMVCPLDNVNDTEIYIYSASQLADVGDLSGLKVGYAEFVYATKLQQLILGSASPYYTNGNLQTLYLGSNKLLKKLDVRNCTGLGTGDQKTVDLSGCTGIEEVYFDGTKITGVTLPNGGVLRKLHLPSTVTSLIIRKQPSLTDFTCPSLSNISTLWLENVGSAVDTLRIMESLQTGARVRIFGFDWEIDDAEEIGGILDLLDDKRGLDQNGDNVPTAQVYGTISVPTVTGDIIAHARQRYPDVTIHYDHVTATLIYLDNDGTVLASETIVDGADPAHTPNLTTKEDRRYYYTFLGWSRAQNGPVEEGVLEDIEMDTTVYAIYSRVEKTFTVRLFNGAALLRTYENVAYGSTIIPDITPTYNGIGRPDDYLFTGWDPAPENITADMDCRAQYEFTGLYFRELMNGTLAFYEDEMNITTVGAYAFAGEEYLWSVSMPHLSAVPDSCFRNCVALEHVSLPSALATNANAFTNSTVMETLTLPELMLVNSTPLAQNMSALKELRMPKNTSSFAGVVGGTTTNLEVIDLGVAAAVGVNMASTAFNKLTYLIMRNTSAVTTPANASSISASSPLGQGEGLILVPRAMVDSYRAHSSWGRYAESIEAIEDHPEICG